ncbi:proteophosphoglycan ppg4 [Leptomonas pyrrhocoris]|uniref:Proteophosphoglycan ppg4 n=1 Tax=Leptomonas pyrrhocoris TaxID=157538 RepID=A0A0M9FRK5_LEPPY|nr:proteophosphoglycan ppg4 [Leptomonas pyrrhocoris]KPA74499.1 proteophosphoglycan ppg4 [Leptomonas pyrrhocoris]|eukprot:XP_015652938.1 proteophosphoglycan ppg4 [Leptomonas pyrrhocoris]
MSALFRLRRCVLVCALLATVLCVVECAPVSDNGVRTAKALTSDTRTGDSDDFCHDPKDCHGDSWVSTYTFLVDLGRALHVSEWSEAYNYCEYKYITCRYSGVEIDLSGLNLIGSLVPPNPKRYDEADPPRIKKITLDGNSGISGSLPASWGVISSLQSFSAAATSISGTLPDEWSNLTALETLLLNHTKIDGAIPESWSALRSLKTVSLSNSGISGRLPVGWGVISSLRSFSAAATSISGTLPDEWSKITALETLLLDHTGIKGTIPESWNALRHLNTVSLSNSGVTGCLPADWTRQLGLTLEAVGLPEAAECELGNEGGSTKKFPWWAILIIVVGAVLVIAVVVVVVVCVVRRNRRKRRERESAEARSSRSFTSRGDETQASTASSFSFAGRMNGRRASDSVDTGKSVPLHAGYYSHCGSSVSSASVAEGSSRTSELQTEDTSADTDDNASRGNGGADRYAIPDSQRKEPHGPSAAAVPPFLHDYAVSS